MSENGAYRESAARSRLLLRRLRQQLAREGDGHQRLNRIVRLVATNMIAEVCSIYLLDGGGALVLAATEGLNTEAVGAARLAKGQGLVGRIARFGETLNTQEAASEPGFQYLPGTGEEGYVSFLGAPIRRQGHTLGVIVVQNRAARVYDEDEVDALELIATVIAEMTDAGAFLSPELLFGDAALRPRMLTGAPAAEGVAIGRVVHHEPKVVLADPIAENIDAERRRLRAAMEKIRGEVDSLVSGASFGEHSSARARRDGLRTPGEHQDVLEAFRMVAHDKGWMRRLETAVASGLKAEAAVEKVQTEVRARLERTGDPYLRERLSDLDDLANRLLRRLLGLRPPSPDDLPDDAILVARTLGPGELLEYGSGGLKALALEEGSATGHAAIVARALNIPLVGALENLVTLANPGDAAIVDGDAGRVLLRPESSVVRAYREKLALRAQEMQALSVLRNRPAVSLDGQRVALHMNAGLITDIPSLNESGAEGIGLYRTELQYLINSRAPRRDAQTQHYARVLKAAGAKPVVFRTLDMGGDKRLPFLKGEREENPALGWRAIRIALDRPLLFRMQLQSLLRAAPAQTLNVMFPMVATPEEFARARDLLLREADRMAKDGRTPPETLRVGAMIETPALVFAPAGFYKLADFLSIGGNDLAQYFFAADRGNERVRGRYSSLDGGFMRMIRQTVARALEADTPLSFCGEFAGRPVGALALVAVGLRSLSMRPAAIGPVKRLLRSVTLGDVAREINRALDSGADNLREILAPYVAAQTAAR